MRLPIALLFAAACSAKTTPSAPTPGSAAAPGSGATAAGSAEPAPPAVVTDRDSATANAGKPARVEGTARNAKLAAAVVLADRMPVYCLGVDSWPSDVDGKPVKASGKLEQTEEFAADDGAAGTSGAVWVLRDCRYESP